MKVCGLDIPDLCVLYRYSWNRIRNVFFHNVGGMDFPDIANMVMDECLPCFNMQWINFYDGQNSVFLDALKVNGLSLKRG